MYTNFIPCGTVHQIKFTMEQNPNSILNNMTTPPLHQETKQYFRHPPPRPPPQTTTATNSKNPKNPIITANSTSLELDQLTKRVTRDLPNLSDCQCCSVRINHTDPNDRLQTLDSVWRIVLLCKKCIRFVNSGQTCPYCFKNIDNLDCCFKCCSCKRCIHKECVDRYGNSAPWSYSCKDQESVESGFSTCIDCWIPRFFRKSIRVCRKAQNCGEKIVKDGNFEPKRKVVLALKAAKGNNNKKTLRKAVVAKNVSELVAKKDKNNGLLRKNSLTSDDTNLTEVVNDEELAFQLHRVMNSSPRISRTVCNKNSSYVGDPENLELSNVPCKLFGLGQSLSNDRGEKLKVYCRARFKEKAGRTSSEAPPCVFVYSRTRLREKVGQICSEAPPCIAVYSRTRFREKVAQTSSEPPPCVKVYSRTRFKEKVGQTSLEPPPCVTVNEDVSRVDSGCSEAELITYKRSRLKRKTCEEKVGLSDHITEEHNLGDDCRDFSGLQFSQLEGSQAQHSLHLQEASTFYPLSSDGDNTVQGEICTNNNMQAESCNGLEDRFLLKYSKRKRKSNPGLEVHEDTFPHAAPEPSIPTNCSVESRTSSNV